MKKNFIKIISLIGVAAVASVVLENMTEARKSLRLDAYTNVEKLSKIKIAVIDNGFNGWEAEKKILPESTKLIAKYDPEFIKKFQLGDVETNENLAQTDHGRVMAQIIWGITGNNPSGPQFYLLNANGITNFRRAVRYAIEEKVDIILYSQNRECCGNFDGGGFLNRIVNDAVSAGILWVNAAGNYGGNVFNSPIKRVNADNSVVFETTSELLIKSRLDENTAQVILTWNSSGPEENTGTDKDLDIYIYDEDGTEVAKSDLKQVWKKPALEEGETFLPRERIRFEFSKNRSGNYKIVVKAKSKNFTPTDKVRLVLIPTKQPIFDRETNKMVNAIELVNVTRGGEIMAPADNPGVITVGDLSPASAMGPTEDGRMKPEILMEESMANFTNGESSGGTSNAAAYFAGVLAVLKAERADLTRSDIITFPKKHISTLSSPVVNVGISEFATMQEKILNTVEDLSNESAVLAGHFSDGRYLLGIRQKPEEVLESLCGKAAEGEESNEVYLALSTLPKGIECFKRSARSEYPWEKRGGGDKRAYIEIRQVYPALIAPNQQGTWLTPTPEELTKVR